MIPINEIFGIAALTLGVLGCLLNNRKLRLCFIVWLISNALQATIHIRLILGGEDVLSLLVRDIVFSILVIDGWFRWGKKTKE